MNIINYSILDSDIMGYYFPIFEIEDRDLISEAEKIIIELSRIGKDKGCYLIYDDNQNYDFHNLHDIKVISNHNEIIPLYVGRTVSFRIRMHQHRNNKSNFLYNYTDAIDNGLEVNNPFGTYVAFWLIEDQRKRMFKEHELIYKFKPIFNKI